MGKKEKIYFITIFSIMFLAITLESCLRLAKNFMLIYNDIGLWLTLLMFLLGFLMELATFGVFVYIAVRIGVSVFNKYKNN